MLTLRVLPFAARLAEQRSASGRGLPAALAGWQFSRRPLRGAGPVLLLIVAVATGMLAIGHGASWDRSQHDQADFRTGAAVRVLDHRPGSPGQTGLYAALPGAREAAPAHRTALSLSGAHEATILALDTSRAGDGMLMRGDLADEPPGELLQALAPPPLDESRAVRLPDGTRRLALDVRITDERARTGRSPSGRAPPADSDRPGRVRHRLPAGCRERPGGRPGPPRHPGTGPDGNGPPRRAGRTAAADRTAARRHPSPPAAPNSTASPSNGCSPRAPTAPHAPCEWPREPAGRAAGP